MISLSKFNQELILKRKEIIEQELRIVLSLSDLLEQKNEYNGEFIKQSLIYLKEKHGLTKSVWHVLLRLNELIPNFTEKLSNWKTELHAPIEPQDYCLLKICTHVGKHELANSKRVHNINKLFLVINELVKNLGLEQACAAVGLIIPLFDTKSSSFSINNLNILRKTLEDRNQIDFIQITYLESLFYRCNALSYCFQRLNVFYRQKNKNDINEQKYLDRPLKEMGFSTDNVL